MAQVLGVSVTDLQIASVVMEVSTGNVLARNVVDLPDDSPESAFDAISQLVESAPFEVESITVACARRSMQVSLHNTVTGGAAGDPEWYGRTVITDTPFAFANVAAAQSDQRGVIVVIDLAENAIPFNELSIAAVDTEAATVVGAVQLPAGGEREPVTEPEGAAAVAAAFDLLPSTDAGRRGVFVVGPGASLAGVGSALEDETQLPVQIADEPTFSAAHGAALHGRSRGGGAGARNRWLILGAAAAAAAVLAAIVVAIVLFSGGDDTPAPAVVSTTVTAPQTTSSVPTTTRSRPPSTTTTTDEAPVEQAPETAEPAPVPRDTVTVTQPPRTIIRTTTPPPSSSAASSVPPASDKPSAMPSGVSAAPGAG